KEIRDGSRVPASRAASRDPKWQTPATMTHLISSLDFAILAPVPLVHLESALPTVNAQGQVVFGAAGVRSFEGVESLRGGEPVPLLIYATHTKGNRPRAVRNVAWLVCGFCGVARRPVPWSAGHAPRAGLRCAVAERDPRCS